MIFLEIFVGAMMAIILMSVGHTLGEAKADRDIIAKFNEMESQLRERVRKDLLEEKER